MNAIGTYQPVVQPTRLTSQLIIGRVDEITGTSTCLSLSFEYQYPIREFLQPVARRNRRSSDIGRSAIGRYRSNYPRTIKHDRCELTPAAWNFVVSLPRWDLQRWSSKRESNRNRLVCPACLRSPSGDRGDLLEWEKKKEMSTPNRWKSREVGISFPTDVEFSHDFRLNVRGLPVQ